LITSDEAQELHEMLSDLRMGEIRSLERAVQDLSDRKGSIQKRIDKQDWESLPQIMELVAKTMTGFEHQFRKIKSKLKTLAAKFRSLAHECQQAAAKEKDMICKAQERRGAWCWIISVLDSMGELGWESHIPQGALAVLVGSGAGLASLVVLHALLSPLAPLVVELGMNGWAVASLGLVTCNPPAAAAGAGVGLLCGAILQSSSAIMIAVPAILQTLALCSILIMALFAIGAAGRQTLSLLLDKLWAEEIHQHEKAKTAFEELERMCLEIVNIKELAVYLDRLGAAIEAVRDTADALQEKADQAQEVQDPQGEVARDEKNAILKALSDLEPLLHEEADVLMSVQVEANLALTNLPAASTRRLAVHSEGEVA